MDRKQKNEEKFYYGYKNDRYNFANFADNTKSTQQASGQKQTDSRANRNANAVTRKNKNVRKRKRTVQNSARQPQKFNRNSVRTNRVETTQNMGGKDNAGVNPNNYSVRKSRVPQTAQKSKPNKNIKPQKNKPIRVHSHKYIKAIRTIISILCVAVVFGIGIYLSLTVWFKTQKIKVVGNTRYTHSQILDLCTIELGENIFLSDKAEAEANIKQNLPYVYNVDVRFSIPETIVIDVTDAEIDYQVYNKNRYLAMSKEGRVLETLTEKKEGIITIVCNTQDGIKVGDYIETEDSFDILNTIKAELEKLHLTEYVSIIDIKNLANIQLIYDNRINIVIGMPEDINYKLRTAITIMEEKIDTNDSGTIMGRLDVSVCKQTKKSYFNEEEVYGLISNISPTTDQTTNTDNSDPTQNTEDTSQSDSISTGN